MTPDKKTRVVVTGAGGALGGAIATHFLSEGRQVLALDQDADGLARLGECEGLDQHVVDLTDAEAVDKVFAAIAPQTSIGLLVNAVGLIANQPFLAIKGAKLRRHDLETWRRVIDANLTATFVVCAASAERMARSGGGVIINFSSVAACGNPGQAAYSAAKAVIEGLTRALAQELGPYGIRVNAVAPGFIDVATTREALPQDQLDAKVAATPLGRLGAVGEVVAAIEALENNPFVTGHIFRVDGGVRL